MARDTMLERVRAGIDGISADHMGEPGSCAPDEAMIIFELTDKLFAFLDTFSAEQTDNGEKLAQLKALAWQRRADHLKAKDEAGNEEDIIRACARWGETEVFIEKLIELGV